MIPLLVAVVGAILVLVIVGLLLRKKRGAENFAGADTYRNLMGGGASAPALADTPAMEQLRQNLRVKYLYQEDKIEAAIALERERTPAASPEQLMKAAIERWERDNR